MFGVYTSTYVYVDHILSIYGCVICMSILSLYTLYRCGVYIYSCQSMVSIRICVYCLTVYVYIMSGIHCLWCLSVYIYILSLFIPSICLYVSILYGVFIRLYCLSTLSISLSFYTISSLVYTVYFLWGLYCLWWFYN